MKMTDKEKGAVLIIKAEALHRHANSLEWEAAARGLPQEEKMVYEAAASFARQAAEMLEKRK